MRLEAGDLATLSPKGALPEFGLGLCAAPVLCQDGAASARLPAGSRFSGSFCRFLPLGSDSPVGVTQM